MIQNMIDWVRTQRAVASFKISTRVLIIFLMVLGLWVATRKLHFPETVNLNDKIIHMIVFFGFAVLIDVTSSRKPFWKWKAIPLIFYGGFVEVVQFFTPDRSFSLLDFVADITGILLYLLMKKILLIITANRSYK